MADRTKYSNGKSTRAKKERFNDVQFVNYNLSPDEKRRCREWLTDLDTLDDVLLKFTQSGYRMSVKYDAFSAGYSAFAACVDETMDNGGLMLSGRGSTPLKAVKQCLFIHYVALDETWQSYAEQTKPEEWDD